MLQPSLPPHEFSCRPAPDKSSKSLSLSHYPIHACFQENDGDLTPQPFPVLTGIFAGTSIREVVVSILNHCWPVKKLNFNLVSLECRFSCLGLVPVIASSWPGSRLSLWKTSLLSCQNTMQDGTSDQKRLRVWDANTHICWQRLELLEWSPPHEMTCCYK